MLKLIVLMAVVSMAFAGPTKENRRGPKDLSDEPHYKEGEEHNPEYDHEAFLGKEEAEEFQHLTPEESRRRLRIIFGKIDVNKDSKIDMPELKKWVTHIANRHVEENTDTQLPQFDLNKDGKITLSEYQKATLGDVEDENAEYDPHRKLTYKEMKERDAKKFKVADVNNDGELSREEFSAFIHPEEYPHMRQVMIDEAMQDMDKDRDGYVTVEEYINDIWPQYERKDDEPEPEWVKNEREQFSQHRDKDENKKLDKRELGEWIAPEGHDNAGAEANHLIYNADKDKDGKLTVDEMLDNEELFVGSQATDFGTYMYKHDEF